MFQAWSQAHDNYLDDKKNTYRPYGSHTQLTIIPFFLLGTYGVIYGSFKKWGNSK